MEYSYKYMYRVDQGGKLLAAYSQYRVSRPPENGFIWSLAPTLRLLRVLQGEAQWKIGRRQIRIVPGDIIVVNKPSGILSVPGKGEDKFDCISTRVRKLIPDCIEQPSVHRLDMDTSGILVLGLTKESHRNLSIQFQDRKVEKKYQALLRGRLSDKTNETYGTIEFPMRVDLENRPYQIYDEEYGRMATTEWKLLEEYSLDKSFLQGEHQEDSLWRTRVEFTPITGRTHQLRLHSAHEKGLGIAIVGDRLYGKNFSDERLCLQAFYLKFTHPTTNQIMEFTVPFEF